MKVSIIIPHYNNNEDLYRCLLSLNNQTIERDSYEIVVVDNGSDELDFDKVKNQSDILISFTKIKNPYSCRNVGIMRASSLNIAFLDAKCIPSNNWVEEGLKCLEKGYQLIGGNFNVTGIHNIATKAYKIMYLDNFHTLKLRTGFPSGNLFVKKELIEKEGKFNDEYLSCEDVRWTNTIMQKGYRAYYCSKAIVSYKAKDHYQILSSAKRDMTFYKKMGNKLYLKMLLPMNPKIVIDKTKRRLPQIRFIEQAFIYLYIWYIKVRQSLYFFTV